MAKKKILKRFVLGNGVLGSRFNQPDHASVCEWKSIIGEYDWSPVDLEFPKRCKFNANKPGRLIWEWLE